MRPRFSTQARCPRDREPRSSTENKTEEQKPPAGSYYEPTAPGQQTPSISLARRRSGGDVFVFGDLGAEFAVAVVVVVAFQGNTIIPVSAQPVSPLTAVDHRAQTLVAVVEGMVFFAAAARAFAAAARAAV